MSDIYTDSVYVQIKLPCKKHFPSPLNFCVVYIDAIDCVQIVTKGVKKTSIVSTVIVNNDVVNELDNANKHSHKVYLYCKKKCLLKMTQS